MTDRKCPIERTDDVALTRKVVLSPVDWIAMSAGAVLCLVISYVFGHNRPLWEDEMLGWMLLHDPSWSHMLFAWRHGADGGGLTFYVTGRGWFKLFGSSDLSFRMYSAVCFALAFCVTWVNARSYYVLQVVLPALFSSWFLSPSLVTHLAEGRFYGLLALMVALIIFFTSVTLQRQEASSASSCGFAFLLNGLLVTTHPLGILYSATVLVGLVVSDILLRRRRFTIYVATAASWLLLLFERDAIRATTQVGKPWFWTTPPDLTRFFGAYCEFSAAIAAVILVGLSMIWWERRKLSRRQWIFTLREDVVQRQPLLIVLFVLFLLPVALTVHAMVGTSLFINRYLMPLTVPEALLLCQLFTMVQWKQASLRPGRSSILVGGVVYSVLLLLFVFVQEKRFTIQDRDFMSALTARLPRNVPVVCEDAWTFTEVVRKSRDSGVHYMYLLDWPQSIHEPVRRLEVTEYHLMQNWRDVGYFSGSIEQLEPFLDDHREFFVIRRSSTRNLAAGAVPLIGNPLVQRFQENTAFQAMPYEYLPNHDLEVWKVCRGSCATVGNL